MSETPEDVEVTPVAPNVSDTPAFDETVAAQEGAPDVAPPPAPVFDDTPSEAQPPLPAAPVDGGAPVATEPPVDAGTPVADIPPTQVAPGAGESVDDGFIDTIYDDGEEPGPDDADQVATSPEDGNAQDQVGNVVVDGSDEASE